MPELQLSDLRLCVEIMESTALLLEHGVRATPLRKTTLSLLFEAGTPLSLKTLSDRFPGKQPDRVSLYRTLSLLELKGIIHKVLGADSVWRYCAHRPGKAGCPGNHAHFVCLACGEMLCLQDQPIPVLHLPEGYTIKGKQLLAYGLCPRCSGSPAQSE